MRRLLAQTWLYRSRSALVVGLPMAVVFPVPGDLDGFDSDTTAPMPGTNEAVVNTGRHRARQELRTLF